MDTLYKLFFSSQAAASTVKHHGLYNHGATCYLNSVLQVLFMTREFRQAVSRFTENNPDTGVFIDADLKDLFDDLLRGTTYTYKIIKALKIDSMSEQRDAAEYFEKILNMTSPDAAKIFHGRMAHRTTCTNCLTVTNSDGPFWHLPFELQDSCSGNYSVVDGINKYFQPSDFSGENQMYCDKCDCKVDASSKYVIKHHPDVLVLLLKRFDFSYQSQSYIKIQCDVDVPYTLNIPEDQTYELYAVVDHFGDLRAGHYTATIKSQDDERWFNFDDIRVSPLDRSPFTDTQNISRFASAYLLFYRKKVVVADIQEKIYKPRKRSRNANTDENEPETKKTKQESDTEDQDENNTLLPKEDQKEINDPENIELTDINQTTPDVIIDVKPGDSETSADRSGPPGGFRDEEIEGRRRKDDKKPSDSPEDMTSKDKNQDIDRYPLSSEAVTESTHLEEPELTVVDQSRPEVSHDFNAGDREKCVSAACDTQDDRSDADRPTMKLNQTEDSDSREHVMKSKDENTDDQEENTYLMFTQTEVTNSETSEQTETKPDAETSANRQDKTRDPPGGFRDEETEGLEMQHVKESPNTHTEDMTENNRDPDDQEEKLTDEGQNERLAYCESSAECDRRSETNVPQEEDRSLSSTGDQTVVKDPDETEQTDSNQVTAGVNLKPGDSERSADRQEDVRDPPGGFRDEETGNSDSHEDMMSKDSDQTKDRSVPSIGEQVVAKESSEDEVTHINQMTTDVNLQPGDSERSSLPAVGKLISDEQDIKSKHVNTEPQEELNDVETEETGKKHEAKNSDSHLKNMNWNNNEQEKDKYLLPCDDQNKVPDPENVGLTETKQKKPDVYPEPGDCEASTESHSPKMKTTDEVRLTENTDRQEDRTSDVIDPVQVTEIIQMTQAMKLSLKPGDSEVSAGHDTQDDMSDAQRLTMNTTTDNIKQTESSDSHENMMFKDSDQEKDRSLSSTGEQAVVKDPDEAEVTHINQVAADVKLSQKPGDRERSALPVYDERNPVPRKLTKITTGDNKQAETSHEQDVKSKDRSTDDGEENRNLLSSEISLQAEAMNPENSEETEKLRLNVSPDVKPGDCKRSDETVVFYNKTRSHEKKRLLDENTDENQITAVSSERTEQKTTKDDGDEVNKHLLCDEVQVRMTDVEGGAERKPCIRHFKHIIMGVLAVVLALILLIFVFFVHL